MKICTWNVNGIRSSLQNGFDVFLETHNPDICCLQEIKIDHDLARKLQQKYCNLHTYWHTGIKKGYSGVGVLIKKKYPPKRVSLGIGDKAIDSEARLICVEYDNLLLLNAYFPHSHRKLARLQAKLEFCNKVYDYLLPWIGKKNIVLTGDFNIAHQEIDLANHKTNRKNAGFLPVERAFIDRLLDLGLIDAFRVNTQESGHYTWWGQQNNLRERNIGWRLDYFLISVQLKEALKQCLHLTSVYGSDHCPVMLEIDI